MEIRTITTNKFILSLFFFTMFLIPAFTHAATLSFAPRAGSYVVGTLLAVNVYVASTDQAMNAVSATVSFPKDKLQIVSISKNNSIVNLWVKSPTFSNTLGQITFGGVILNPGFIGSSGKLVTVVFRTKAPGTATILFSSAAVLANDGAGTNILVGTGRASFSFVSIAHIIAPKENTATIATSTTTVATSTTTVATSTMPIQEIIISTSTVPMVSARKTELFRFIFSTMNMFALLVSISALVILFILLLYYGERKIRVARHRIRQEVHGVGVLFERGYEVLENSIQEHLTLLHKKHKKTTYDTETEEALLRLEQQLEKARKIVKEEEKDIEKNLS